MERPGLSTEGKVHRLGEPLDLAQKVLRGQVVTIVIHEDNLPFYLRVASKTGFPVTKIAGGGEDFPVLYLDGDGNRIVSNVKVPGKDYLAVAIEKPRDAANHSGFWGKTSSYS